MANGWVKQESRARTEEQVTQIMLEYDSEHNFVTAVPAQVTKGSKFCFKTLGSKVRVAFLTLFGNEADVMGDSDIGLATVGGIYHFNCYFTPAGSTVESPEPSVGIIDVIPHRA